MEGAQVKELIQRWRQLNADLKEKNKDLERSRESLHELDGEHTQAVQQWDLEKENICNTINAILAQVTAKREELQRIEAESRELQAKVDERRERNAEHLSVLNKRRQVVHAQLQAAEDNDRGIKERLKAFQSARDTCREQLQAAIKKIEDARPQEQADHEAQVRQLKSKINETKATAEAEAQSWAFEQAMREWTEKSSARKLLLDEVSAAESGKDTWANILQEADDIHVGDSIRKINEIRATLSVQ